MVTLLEKRFSHSLNEKLQEFNYPMFRDVSDKRAIIRMLFQGPATSDLLLEVKLNYFYSSVSSDVIETVFEMIESWSLHVKETSKKSWSFVKHYFIQTPILLPNGQLVKKYSGISYGSEYTRIVATLVANILAIVLLSSQDIPAKFFQTKIHYSSRREIIFMRVPESFSKETMVSDAKRYGFNLRVSEISLQN